MTEQPKSPKNATPKWGKPGTMRYVRDRESRTFSRTQSPEFQSRFWGKVHIREDDECWVWLGSKNKGYGRIRLDGRWIAAHRVSCSLQLGRPLGPRFACHTCDNPSCCNPNHLYAGTRKQNGRDASERGRMNPIAQDGELNSNAKLDQAKVAEIRKRLKTGETNTALASRFGVVHSTISNIRRGVSWKSSETETASGPCSEGV